MPNFDKVAAKKINTVNSLEVAEMCDVMHKNLVQSIRKYIEVLTGSNISPLDFFIESAYADSKRENRVCYLLTKKGCDMVANKMTGEKGVIFTAKYVTRFEEMENQIKTSSYMIENPIDRAMKWIEEEKIRQQQQAKLELQAPLVQLAETRIDKKGCFSITDVTKALGLKRGNITRWAKEEGYLHKTQTEVNKFGEEYFKVYSSDAKHNQIGVLENGLQLIKENLDKVRRS